MYTVRKCKANPYSSPFSPVSSKKGLSLAPRGDHGPGHRRERSDAVHRVCGQVPAVAGRMRPKRGGFTRDLPWKDVGLPGVGGWSAKKLGKRMEKDEALSRKIKSGWTFKNGAWTMRNGTLTNEYWLEHLGKHFSVWDFSRRDERQQT